MSTHEKEAREQIIKQAIDCIRDLGAGKGGWAWEEVADALAALASPPVQAREQAKLDDIEQYRMQMAVISTASFGYWKEGDGIHPDYDTLALRDVAKLYAKYDEYFKLAHATAPAEQAKPSAVTNENATESAETLSPAGKAAKALPAEQAKPSAGGARLVTLKSACRAIDHISLHNGPGRLAEATAMLVEVDAPEEQQPSAAARDVLAERRRQISAEGWTPEHDDEHDNCELARAAACYAIGSPMGGHWPAGWKFKDDGGAQMSPGHRRGLVKAGALILAEIERLDRASHTPSQGAAPDGVKP